MSLVKIAPLDPTVVLPLGDDGKPAVQVGVTERGVPYYRLKRIRAGKHVPRLGEDGKQVVVKHETTGVEMYRKWRRERVESDHVFTLESDGHGTMYMHDFVEPTAEERELIERERRAAEFRERLVTVAAERGISADVFMDRLMAETGGESAPSDPAADAEFPRKAAGVGMWELSDGTKVRGSKDAAEAAEQALHAGAY